MIQRWDLSSWGLQFRRNLYDFLAGPGWNFGWKSNTKNQFSFWHKHFAGNKLPDHEKGGEQYNCLEELQKNAPLVAELWRLIDVKAPNVLVRAYANGMPFGTEGSIHTDSISDKSFTFIYYPHLAWWPDWGGETVFFNKDYTDIIDCVFPKAGRLIAFNGTIPHVARSVSRTCPEIRITLMFKTEVRDEATQRTAAIPAGPGNGQDTARPEKPI
jgi:SM-20-related protein